MDPNNLNGSMNGNHHHHHHQQHLQNQQRNDLFLQTLEQDQKTKKQKQTANKHDRCIFQSVQFALAIVRNPFPASPHFGKWLAVNETNGRGWWVPGGCVERGETFVAALHRECLEEANMRIAIKGILKVDHSVSGDVCRMRVIYYCEPTSLQEANNFKTMPDAESLEARWVSINELLVLATGNPGLRGRELLNWATYLENNGHVMPLEMFGEEGEVQPLGSKSAPMQTAQQQQQQQQGQAQQQQQQQQRQQQASQLQQQQQQQQSQQQRQLQQLQSQLMQPTPLQPKTLETTENLFLQGQSYGDASSSSSITPEQKQFMEWANAKRKEQQFKFEAV